MSSRSTYARWARAGIGGLVGAVTAALLLAPPAGAALGDVTEFSIAPAVAPFGIAAGPDGNLWVTGQASSTISRVSTSGVVATFPTPTAGAFPTQITAGPDGNLWFTEFLGNRIGRITPAGVITEFAVPTAAGQPYGIAAGPDGNLWFTEYTGNKIGRITPAGAITEFALPTPNSGPVDITAGPPGSERMYFTQYLGNRLGTISTVGTVVNAANLGPATGPTGVAVINGSVWLVAYTGNALVRMVNDATPAIIALGPGNGPRAITGGPGNTIWVSASVGNAVLRFDSQGVAQGKSTMPTGAARPSGIAVGPDGNIWAAEFGTDKVARIIAGGVPTMTAAPAVTPATGAVPGTVLTAANGTWTNTPTGYSYQWQSCGPDVATCADIAGATAATYTAQAGDSGRNVRVRVIATNASGPSAGAFSGLVPVGKVTPPPPPPPPTATGPTAALAAGVTATLFGPSTQKRNTTKAFTVTFSASDAQGSVTFVITKGKKKRTFANVPVAGAASTIKWKAPANWGRGTANVRATFVPVVGSPYASGAMKRPVRLT